VEPLSFDPIWEEKYKAGHQQRAPWDQVVSFLFRNMPKNKPRSETTILEVGCGTASNLWFAALEGFDVYGIDGSRSAIELARKRFAEENLSGDLRVGDFTTLPFDDNQFDLVIDRFALSCCGTTSMKKAIGEIHRVLKPGGKFLFTPASDEDKSWRSGRRGEDDVIIDIQQGLNTGCGQLRFLSRAEIEDFVPADQWDVRSLELVEVKYLLGPVSGAHDAHWRVIAAKR
jgi:SAM-dependent methyltransferase